MHELFPNWFTPQVSLQPDAARLALRWTAIEALTVDLTASDAISFVQNALALGDTQSVLIREAARKADPSYISSDDALEVRVLAAGVCLNLLNKKGVPGNAVALALLTSTFSRTVTEAMIRDLLALSKQHLQSSSEKVRQTPSTFPAFSAKEQRDLLAKMAAAPDVPTLQADMIAAVGVLSDAISNYATRVQGSFNWLAKLQAEDSDVSYLIVSENSLLAKKPYSSMSKIQTAFLAAADLGSITRFAPLLPAYEAVLPTIFRSAKGKKDTTIRLAVNELAPDVLDICCSATLASAMPMPLLFAIAKREEVKGQDTWVSAFDAVTGIDSNASVTAAEISNQYYLETQLGRILAGQI